MSSNDVNRIWIKGGHLIDPATKTDGPRDLLIENGRIAAVDTKLNANPGDVQVIDATGLVVTPGLVDIHVHLREPGRDAQHDAG
jgi:dihydroorotase